MPGARRTVGPRQGPHSRAEMTQPPLGGRPGTGHGPSADDIVEFDIIDDVEINLLEIDLHCSTSFHSNTATQKRFESALADFFL